MIRSYPSPFGVLTSLNFGKKPKLLHYLFRYGLGHFIRAKNQGRSANTKNTQILRSGFRRPRMSRGFDVSFSSFQFVLFFMWHILLWGNWQL